MAVEQLASVEKPTDTKTMIWRGSAKERDIVERVKFRFQRIRGQRDKTFSLFNERSLRQYIDDCQKRFNSYIEPREDADDWTAKVFSPDTRNKTIAILAKLASQRTKVNFFGKEKDDKIRAKIIKALYEYSEVLYPRCSLSY